MLDRSLIAASLIGLVACSAGGEPIGGKGGNGASSPGGGGAGAEGAAGGSGGQGTGASGAAGGAGGNFGGSGTGGTGGFEECAGVSSTATAQLQPADIIIAVDTSGSMDEESAEVQANLNAFASLIVASGIDVHVVLIADANVCIPAPLGSGQCGGADENLPSFRHVVQTVNSTDALSLMISTYPLWSSSLRPGATKTLAVVSDDDSDLGAAAFTSQLLALDPPTFQGFKFDSIVSSTSPDACIFGGCFFNCGTCTNPCCDQSTFCQPLSAEQGTVYQALTAQTMGVNGDLCSQDFDPVFQSMATAVVQSSALSCSYEIPPPPEGETLDPGLVNVVYTTGAGAETQIPNVPGGVADCDAQGGWYFDDAVNPTEVIVCPATCTVLQADTAGKVDVVFGCETVVVVPQ